MAAEEKEYPNKETEELFEGVENGDEEVIKVLLLGNKNKQFELDINFQFKKKVFFQTPISLSFFLILIFISLFFLISLFIVVVHCWIVLCCCDIYFVFILFLTICFY